MSPIILLAGQGSGSSNLKSAYDGWINVIAGSGNILGVLGFIGISIVVFGVAMLIWAKRHGNAGLSRWMFVIICGAALTLPKLVIPAILVIADWFVNLITYLIPTVIGK